MSYTIETDDKTEEYDSKEEWQTMQDLLDDQGVEYTASEPESKATDGGSTTPEDENNPVLADEVQLPEEEYEAMHEAVAQAEQEHQPDVLPSGGLDDPLETLPEWMKTEVDRHGGDLDLNKRGCQVIANYLELDVKPEPVKRAHDTDFEYAVFEAIVYRDGAEIARAEAEAHIDESNVQKWDLNRMAETRAKKRATKWATGGGIEAFAKHEQGAN